MSYHRYIVVQLRIGVGPENTAAPGRKGGQRQRPPDYDEVVADLKRQIKGLKARNNAGKSYDIGEVDET